jgi:hypothetical protein
MPRSTSRTTPVAESRPLEVRKRAPKQNRLAVTWWHQGFGVIFTGPGMTLPAVPFTSEATCRKVAARAAVNVAEYRQRRRLKTMEPLLVEQFGDLWVYREAS